MSQVDTTRVFMSGRSQAVRIPAAYRFSVDQVYIRRDPQNGDLILSQAPQDWQTIYAALDEAGFDAAYRDEFLADRAQGEPETREGL